jgi:hypothetical protein
MNLGEMLRAKLMMAEINEATKPKVEGAKPAPVPQPRKPFQISNNLNRVLFEQAQNYPTTRKALVSRMESMGFKPGSVATIIGQMLRQGLLQADNEGVLHLTVAEYTPLKSSRTMRRRELAKGKNAAKPKQIKISVRNRTVEEVREERPVSSPPVIKSVWNAHDAVAGLTVLQAQELYAELKKIFSSN